MWEFFLNCLEGCLSAEFVWVKAYRDWAGLEGFDQVMARGNAFADQIAAKQIVYHYKAASALYQQVVRSKLHFVKIRNQTDVFHLHLAYAAIGLQRETPVYFGALVALVPKGPAWSVDFPGVVDSGFPYAFVRQVFNWFCALQWYRGCFPGPVCDISWVEPFLWWIVDNGTCHHFVSMVVGCVWGADEHTICCIPSACTLFCTWHRAVSMGSDTWRAG